MKTFSIIIGGLAAILGFVLAFVLGSFAFIPVILGLICGIIALIISRKNGQKDNIPKLIIGLSLLAGVVTTVNLFKEDKLNPDEVKEQLEQEKKSQEKDLKELEEEGL